MCIKFIIILIAVANCNPISEDSKLHGDDNLVLLENLMDLSDDQIKEVYGEILEEYQENLRQSISLYKKISTSEYQLKQQLGHDVTQQSARLIALSLNKGEFTIDGDIIRNLFDLSLLQKSFELAVDEVYHIKPIEELAAALKQFCQKPFYSGLCEPIMVQIQLYLFSKFNSQDDINDLYLLNMGYYFYQIQTRPSFIYQAFTEEIERRLENAIKKLPTTLQNFYFKQHFCLVNKATSEYLYIDAKNASVRNEDRFVEYVLTRNATNAKIPEPQTVLAMKVIGTDNNDDGKLNLEFALFSQIYHMYLDRIPLASYGNENVIAAWRYETEMPPSVWKAKFIENQLVFSQNNHIMCANPEFYNDKNKSHLVYGKSIGYDFEYYHPSDALCQWSVVEC